MSLLARLESDEPGDAIRVIECEIPVYINDKKVDCAAGNDIDLVQDLPMSW